MFISTWCNNILVSQILCMLVLLTTLPLMHTDQRFVAYHLFYIQAVCTQLQHQTYPRNHHTQSPTALHSKSPPFPHYCLSCYQTPVAMLQDMDTLEKQYMHPYQYSAGIWKELVVQSPGGETQISCNSSEPSGQCETLSQSWSSVIHTAVASGHISPLRGHPV